MLSKLYKTIDINDLATTHIKAKWIETKEKLSQLNARKKCKIDEMYEECMTKIPFDKTYNLIYGSWAFNYLTDKQIIDFLHNAKKSLIVKDGQQPGMIMLKETTRPQKDTSAHRFVDDQKMFIRTSQEYKDLFEEADYDLVMNTKDKNNLVFNG